MKHLLLNALPRRSGRVTGPAPSFIKLSADERRNCHLRIQRFVELSPAAEVKALQVRLSDIEDHLPVNGQFRSDCLKYIAARCLQIMAQKNRNFEQKVTEGTKA